MLVKASVNLFIKSYVVQTEVRISSVFDFVFVLKTIL